MYFCLYHFTQFEFFSVVPNVSVHSPTDYSTNSNLESTANIVSTFCTHPVARNVENSSWEESSKRWMRLGIPNVSLVKCVTRNWQIWDLSKIKVQKSQLYKVFLTYTIFVQVALCVMNAMTKSKPTPKGNTCAKNADQSLMGIHSDSGVKCTILIISIVRDATRNWLRAQWKSKLDLDTRPMSWTNSTVWSVISRWEFPFVGLVDVPLKDEWSLPSVIDSRCFILLYTTLYNYFGDNYSFIQFNLL